MTAIAEQEARVVGRRAQARLRPWLLLSTLLILILGGAEGWFGKTDAGDLFGSDAVQYLDCARAVGRGDVRSALNPLWSQGYPVLLALARPAFAPGPWGDWLVTRAVNVAILLLCWAGFCAWMFALLDSPLASGVDPTRRRLLWIAGVCVFVTTQLGIGQVSRVGPDQLLAAAFFFACTLLLRLLDRPGPVGAIALGVVLGVGFLVKAALLPIGLFLLLCLASALWRRRILAPRALVRTLACALLPFVLVAGTYGVLLSRAVGHPTLGDSGSLNYAWHVNRLAKWVHWEGGAEPAEKAWPKPGLARFAHWETDPPDFGRPTHPSVVTGNVPHIYVFHAPVIATYIPYYDPPYWYEGYHHVFRWRYQAIALLKNMLDLAQVLLGQPLFYAVLLLAGISAASGTARRTLLARVLQVWPLAATAVFAVVVFLPVHLEGRYLSGALAALSMLVIAACVAASPADGGVRRPRLALTVLLATTVAGLAHSQSAAWGRLVSGWTPRHTVQWQAGQAVAASGLPAGAEVGMLSWDPNLHCDWAYLAGVRITSETATGADEQAFWALPPSAQGQVLAEFHRSGAQAVLTWDRPQGAAAGWTQLPATPMWIYRF